MNLYSWLKGELQQLRRQRTPPSPLIRKFGKVMKILFLLCLAAFLVWRVVLHRDVTRQLDRIRAAGLPSMGLELNAWQTVPDAENGALVLTQAFTLLRTFPDRRSNEVRETSLFLRTNRWAPPLHAMVAAYAETNQAALIKIQEGLRFPRYRYPVDYSYGLDTQNPYLGPLREAARIEALQAVLEAEAGRTDSLAAKVDLQLQLASTLDLAPTALAYLTRTAMIRTAARTTERCLNQASPNDETYASLQTSFSRVATTNLLPSALIGERALLAPFFRMTWKELQRSSRGGSDEGETHIRQQLSGKPTGAIWWSGILERDLWFFLETMEQGIALAALPCPGNLSITNFLNSAEKRAREQMHLFAGLMLPSFSKLALREASTQALVLLTQAALATERFRLKTGKLPSALSELVPDYLPKVPEDPFDGAPLRYRTLPTGYAIYSIGEDGHDDGGREPPERKKSTDKSTYDLTFIVERSAGSGR
jgi:hypothetical protein